MTIRTARKRVNTLPPHMELLKAVIVEAQRNAAGQGSPVPSWAERRSAESFVRYLRGEDVQ